MNRKVVRIGCWAIRFWCLFCIVSLCGCEYNSGWGKILNVHLRDKIKPYAEQGSVTMGIIGSKELRVVLPIAGKMGMEALDAATFAILGASVFDDSRCKYAAEECKKVHTYSDPLFVVVSISPKSEMTKWPLKYVLEVTDIQKNKSSYVAIQPLAEEYSPFEYCKVGFCTRLEGVDAFDLLFIVPKNVALDINRVALQSHLGVLKWRKESQSK